MRRSVDASSANALADSDGGPVKPHSSAGDREVSPAAAALASTSAPTGAAAAAGTRIVVVLVDSAGRCQSSHAKIAPSAKATTAVIATTDRDERVDGTIDLSVNDDITTVLLEPSTRR